MPSLLDYPIREQAWLKGVGEKNGCSAGAVRLRADNGEQTKMADAGPWEPTILKLVEFQHLGDDWDGLRAKAPSLELLESAIGLAYCFLENGVDPPSAIAPGLWTAR